MRCAIPITRDIMGDVGTSVHGVSLHCKGKIKMKIKMMNKWKNRPLLRRIDSENENTGGDDLTSDERKDMRQTGETENEAHRQGEYDALSAKIDAITAVVERLETTLDGISERLGGMLDDAAAVSVENGAVVSESDAGDVDNDGDTDADDIETTLDELDYNI